MVGGVGPEPTAVTPGTKVPGSRSRDETPLPRPSRPQIEPAAAPRREPVALARTAVVSPTEASPGASIAPAAPRLPPIPPRRERLRSDLGLARAATPPAETTIHVSIGRIEVRAAATVPVREPRRVASPVMSLEEYLRARAGRARS